MPTTNTQTHDELLTPDEVAARLKVSRRKVYYMLEDDQHPLTAAAHVTPTRITPESLEATIHGGAPRAS